MLCHENLLENIRFGYSTQKTLKVKTIKTIQKRPRQEQYWTQIDWSRYHSYIGLTRGVSTHIHAIFCHAMSLPGSLVSLFRKCPLFCDSQEPKLPVCCGPGPSPLPRPCVVTVSRRPQIVVVIYSTQYCCAGGFESFRSDLKNFWRHWSRGGAKGCPVQLHSGLRGGKGRCDDRLRFPNSLSLVDVF